MEFGRSCRMHLCGTIEGLIRILDGIIRRWKEYLEIYWDRQITVDIPGDVFIMVITRLSMDYS